MENTAIELKNISKDYYLFSKNIQRVLGIIFNRKPSETKHALKNISLTVEKGERLAVIGIEESGCTTLMKIMAGVAFATKGRLTVNGTTNVILNSKVGIDDEIKCIENIYLKANVVGIRKKEIEGHIDEIVEFAGIENYREIAVRSSPKGTNVMIGVATHCLLDADILLLDDKFSGGGAPVRVKCEDRIKRYLADNPDMTAVIATNNRALATSICSRAILLDRGKVAFEGPVDEAFDIFNRDYIKSFGKASK